MDTGHACIGVLDDLISAFHIIILTIWLELSADSFRMSWEMQYYLYSPTNKIFLMQWTLLKSLTSSAYTHSGSATGIHSEAIIRLDHDFSC